MVSADDIIKFWFEDIKPAQWWKKDSDFDALIRQRFAQVHQAASRCELFHWRESALGRVAEVIVLDQFSRNIYRDSAAAFAQDPLALALAQEAVRQQCDKELSGMQRAFLYMPYMHSESLAIHEQALLLFNELGLAEQIDFEIRHKRIIERFGRYPHRNDVLGRKSSPEEVTFLKEPGSSF